jgi:hypothetical protein
MAGEADGAYYLAGCAVECALKACIAHAFLRHTWPDRRFVQDIHTHDLERLVVLAGLRPRLEEAFREDRHFRARWDIVRQWESGSRYRSSEREETLNMYEAIAHARHGVLRWIRKHW